MKVTNWCKKLRVTLLAAGMCAPGMAYAIDIPLGDPSFEDYELTPAYPTGDGYAYSDLYRPVSAWVDDLNGAGFPADYAEDDGLSNWLYEFNYGEAGPSIFRPAPRTGLQAMHGNADPGAGHYSAQISGAVFEAKHTYRFSLWVQNDFGGVDTEGLFMYLFDGSEDFSDSNSLAGAGSSAFTAANGDFNNRGNGMTQEQSEQNWTRISISHYVENNALEIGNTVGVGFFLRDDTAVDDATLQVAPLLHLEVNTVTGEIIIKNEDGTPAPIDYYQISSAHSSLNKNNTFWESLEDQQTVEGFEGGDGSGNGWEEFGTATSSKLIGESNPSGFGTLQHSLTEGISLGSAFRPGFQQDLVFEYGVLLDSIVLDGDFNGDNVVDAADFVAWSKIDGTAEGYQAFVSDFGRIGGPSGASTLVRGDVEYFTPGGGGTTQVPEPTTALLVGLGLGTIAAFSRRRSTEN